MIVSRSYLIVDPKNTLTLLAGPDRFTLELEVGKQTLGIEQIRRLKNWAKLKPFSDKEKYAFIPAAQRLTIEAQNSMLKILEEPPLRTIILLTVDDPSNLLPTIISRCLVFSLSQIKNSVEFLPCFNVLKFDSNAIVEENFVSITKLSKCPLEERFKWVKKNATADKSEILNVLNYWTTELRNSLLSQDLVENKIAFAKLIRKTTLAKKALQQNVNKSLVLENLLLQLD